MKQVYYRIVRSKDRKSDDLFIRMTPKEFEKRTTYKVEESKKLTQKEYEIGILQRYEDDVDRKLRWEAYEVESRRSEYERLKQSFS